MQFAVSTAVNTHIYYNSAGLDHVPAHRPGLSDRNNKNVSLPGYGPQVHSVGMANGYSSVFVEKEFGYRQSDNIASSDNYRSLALNLHISSLGHADGAARGAWNAVLGIFFRLGAATPQGSHILRMETVHVLFPRDGIESLHLVYVVRKWKLNEDAVNAFIFVQQSDLLQKSLFRGVLGQMYGSVLNS